MKIGDKVVMNDKYKVSDKNKGKVFVVRSNPWNVSGTQCVLLEGYSGGYAERIVGQRVAHGHHAQRFQRADSAAVRFERGNRGLPCGAHNTPLCHDRMIVRRAEFPIIRGGAIRRNTACGRSDKAKPRRPFGLPGFQAVISRFTLQRAGPCQP